MPVQIKHSSGKQIRVWDWDGSQQNDVRNNDSFIVYGTNVFLTGVTFPQQAPSVIGDYLYAPTMLGGLRSPLNAGNARRIRALVSVSDLGPAEDTGLLALPTRWPTIRTHDEGADLHWRSMTVKSSSTGGQAGRRHPLFVSGMLAVGDCVFSYA